MNRTFQTATLGIACSMSSMHAGLGGRRASILCVMSAGLLACSGSATGRVINQHGGEPIQNVAISIDGTETGVETGSQGEFIVGGLSPGSHSVTANHPDYVSLGDVAFTAARAKMAETSPLMMFPRPTRGLNALSPLSSTMTILREESADVWERDDWTCPASNPCVYLSSGGAATGTPVLYVAAPTFLLDESNWESAPTLTLHRLNERRVCPADQRPPRASSGARCEKFEHRYAISRKPVIYQRDAIASDLSYLSFEPSHDGLYAFEATPGLDGAPSTRFLFLVDAPPDAKAMAPFIEQIKVEVSLTDSIDTGYLHNLGCEELWALRNWVFARHGYTFSTDEAHHYFSSEPEYAPDPAVTRDSITPLLSPVDRSNIQELQRLESSADCPAQ